MPALHGGRYSPRKAIVASCAYPVEEGLVVETHAPEAIAARRLTLEFLLSRYPQSDMIQEMAAMEGVTSSRFGPPPLEQTDELCMLSILSPGLPLFFRTGPSY